MTEKEINESCAIEVLTPEDIKPSVDWDGMEFIPQLKNGEKEEVQIIKKYSKTDVGNSERFVFENNYIMYCQPTKSWYIWNRKYWEQDKHNKIVEIAKETVKRMYIEAWLISDIEEQKKCSTWAISSHSEKKIDSMIKLARSSVPIDLVYFDVNKDLFNLKNGTFNLNTQTLQMFDKSNCLTRMSNIEYDANATCPCWEQHLQLVFNDNKELIECFQEMCGYSLLSGNPEQKLFFLYGNGENGKSVTLQVLHNILGDYSATVAPETLMVKSNVGGARSDIARLVGTRLVTASEGENNNKLAEAMVKQLTGNETITVRRLYESEFEFEPEFTIWFATNHLPDIKGTDHAIWRRIWLIPFDVKIPSERKIPCYDKILMAESSGIFNWMMEGLKRYKENGKLKESDVVNKKTNEYKDESNNVLKFFNIYYKFDELGKIVKSEFYDMYRRWSTEEGETLLLQKEVTRILKEMGVTEGKALHGYKPYSGIRMKTADELKDDEVSGSFQMPINN